MKITGPIDVIDIGGHPELELDENEYEAGYLATTIIAQTPIEYHRSLLRSIMLEHDKIEMGGDIDARFRVMQIPGRWGWRCGECGWSEAGSFDSASAGDPPGVVGIYVLGELLHADHGGESYRVWL